MSTEKSEPGVKLLWFNYSDGDAARLANLDAKYRHLTINEKPAIEWRRKTGKAVAEILAPEKYCVASWPSGYSLTEVSRGDNGRKDLYLWGGPRQYRSVPEFAPHAAWLLSPNRETVPCQCLRCPAGREQRKAMKPGAKEYSSPTKASTIPQSQEKQAEASPLEDPIITVVPLEAPTQAQRLTSHVIRKSRLFRMGELVWLALNTTLVNEAAPDPITRAQSSIRYWPVVVEDYRLQSRASAVGLGRPSDYITEQELTYQVKFVCLVYSKVVPENQLLAYKLHNPPQETIDYIRTLPAVSAPLSRYPYWFRLHKEGSLPGAEIEEEEASVFDNPYIEAISQYAVALQVAAHVAITWTPCETWSSHNDLVEDGSSISREDREFLGLWWGSELLAVGELALLSCSLAHLAPHPSVSPHLTRAMLNIPPELALQTALVLDLRRVSTAEAGEREHRSLRPRRKCLVTGRIFACVPNDLSSVSKAHDPALLPRQPPPGSQYRWESVLVPEVEAQVDVSLVAGRYYPALPPRATDCEELVGEAMQARRPGMYDTPQPAEWIITRMEIMEVCMRRAREELDAFWKEGAAQE